MPPVYAQQNDAVRRQNAQRQASNQGSPAQPPRPAPPSTTAQQTAASPTTADNLVALPTPLDSYRPPQTGNPAQQNSVYGPPARPAPAPAPHPVGPVFRPTPQQPAWLAPAPSPVLGPVYTPGASTPAAPAATPPQEVVPPLTRNLYQNDLFKVETPSGGTTQSHRTDYSYNPATSSFEPTADSNSVPNGANNISIWGGVSDDFRYNNDASQKPDTRQNVNIGDTVWEAGGLVEALPHYENEVSAGNENLGASADITAGVQANASAAYGYNGDTFEATVAGDVFVGVEVNAEAHAAYGPVAANVSAEAKAGAAAEANAGVTWDPRNGFSGEVGAGAFAGVEVNLEATGELGDSADVTGGVAFKAGIGAELDADVEFGLDEIGAELNIGATLGIGLDVTIDVSISPTGIIDDAGDVLGGAKSFVGGLFGG